MGGCDHRSARPPSKTGASELEMAYTRTPSALGCYGENTIIALHDHGFELEWHPSLYATTGQENRP